jgi:CheY-like chemotaxis protein
VVEDDLSTRDFLVELLASNGCRVAAAENGLDALQILRRLRPCVVLLDLHMPLLDGRGFVEASQSDAEFLPPVPIICVSGIRDAMQEAQRLGIRDCLTKPIDPDELIAYVQRYCGR